MVKIVICFRAYWLEIFLFLVMLTDGDFIECMSYFFCVVRWVDEVIPDAPWVIDQAFLDKHQIDYVAHDSLP